MDKNNSLMLAAVVFGIIALFHLIRSIFSWPVSIAGLYVPVWLSYIGFAAAGFLAWHMYSSGRK